MCTLLLSLVLRILPKCAILREQLGDTFPRRKPGLRRGACCNSFGESETYSK